MRYIDADKIIYTWLTDANGKEHDGVTLQSVIDAQPTADVRENVRGEWIYSTNNESVCEEWTCSLCGTFSLENTNFCPNCGAQMKEE